MHRASGLISLVLLAVVLGGCAGGGVRAGGEAEAFDEPTYDPFESYNRAIFAFNETFDAWLSKPLARGYDWLLPQPVKSSIGNFFGNLFQPAVAVNDLLQGKVKQSGRDAGRFVVNSTIGVLGLFDPAKSMGLEPKDEDWGQTFAVWGIGEGPYLVWPIIGPRYLRETVGWGFDWVSKPTTYVDDPYWSWGLVSLEFTDVRARLLPAEKVIEQAAGDDKYLFIREAYRQRRLSLVYDGNPPRPKFFDDEPDYAPAGDEPARTPDGPADSLPAP